jgi:hypothetical protein
VVHTRLTSQAETKILLSKVDAVYSQLAQLERDQSENQQHIEISKVGHPGPELLTDGQDLGQDQPNSFHTSVKILQEEMDDLRLALQVCYALVIFKLKISILTIFGFRRWCCILI